MFSCLFCDISKKKISAPFKKESPFFFIIPDKYPLAPIHDLIISKDHFISFQEIPYHYMADFTQLVQSFAQELGLDQSGYQLKTHVKKDGGQEIMHLHFHFIVPKKN